MRSRIVPALAFLIVAPIVPNIVSAIPASASTQHQAYTCTGGGISMPATYTVTGKATLSGQVIKLSGVTFMTTNTLGTTVTLKNLTNDVPDPNPAQAPYKSGSAAVATSPAGWTVSHGTGGLIEHHLGKIVSAANVSTTSAAFGAKYKVAAPGSGDVIVFKPGDVTFTMTSPIAASVTCVPDAPVLTFASVTE